MAVYFEGTGNPSPVSVGQARDQLMVALKNKRDEVLEQPRWASYEDNAALAKDVANATISAVLSIIDGDSEDYPAVNFIPMVPDDDITEAIEAGADYFDPATGDISNFSLASYWDMISN